MTRLLISLLAALTIFGAVLGSAASLTVTSTSLAGGTSAVSGCDTSVDLAFGLLSTDLSKVAQVTISSIDATACVGEDIAVQLLDSTGTVLTTGSGTVATSGTETINLLDSVLASLVGTVTVTISG